MKKTVLLAFFFIAVYSFGQKNQKELIVSAPDSLIVFNNYVQYYIDTTRELPFSEVQNKTFISLEKPPIDIQATIWYKILITPEIKTSYLVITPNIVDDTDFYVPQKNNYIAHNIGICSKNKKLKYDTSDAVILKLKTKEIDFSKPFYFNKRALFNSGKKSFVKNGFLIFSNDKDSWYNSNVLNYSYTTNYQTITALVFFASLLFFVNFLVLKDRNFLNYSLYLLFTALIFIPTFPFFFNIANTIHPKLSSFIELLSISMTGTIYFYFVIQFIEVKNSFPKIHKLTKYTVIFSFTFGILELLQRIIFPYFKYRIVFHNYFNYIFLTISITVFIYLVSQKLSILKRFVVLGSFLLIIGQLSSLLLGNPFYFLTAVLLEIIVFSVVVSLQNKQIALREIKNQIALNNEKQKKENLLELDKLKTIFITNISHEFRTPLTLISGPIQQQLSKRSLNEKDRKNLEIVQRNTNRLIKLSDELLDVSKLELGNLKLNIETNALNIFIDNLINDFSILAKQKSIHYTIVNNIDTNKYYYDEDILEKIISNLLSNAIKYTAKNGTINIYTRIKNKHFIFNIKNSSTGLSNVKLSKIFERFYQIDSHQQGTGIGLALVKELVALHKGEIHAKNIKNEWLEFEVLIPIEKVATNLEKQDTSINNIVTNELAPNKTNNNEKPILLIVEDNEEICLFIASLFNKQYEIIIAENGRIGIDKAIQFIPDLIISDIMMPKVDGITLCNTLIKNRLTSHIPILLLTAKTGDENKLLGIKTGAIDYITKPFNPEFLQLKVKNILSSRLKFQQKFKDNDYFNISDITVSELDKNFITQLQTVMDEKLIESSFNIEAFSEALHMSRMQLHRKLKALTGLSASEFIRNQRLKLAVALLKKSDVNIAQIGYSVGFNDHAYFSKCFKKAYGCSPSEYIEKHK